MFTGLAAMSMNKITANLLINWTYAMYACPTWPPRESTLTDLLQINVLSTVAGVWQKKSLVWGTKAPGLDAE